MHVKQLELQVLQILLSEISPNSFEFVQLVPHSHVPLFPKRGLGQASTHEESDLYRGESHVKQLVAVPIINSQKCIKKITFYIIYLLNKSCK